MRAAVTQKRLNYVGLTLMHCHKDRVDATDLITWSQWPRHSFRSPTTDSRSTLVLLLTVLFFGEVSFYYYYYEY